MEYPTLTVDLIDSGALSLLRDMERLNLIRVNPQESRSAEWERTLAVLKRAQGAWKDNPWENYREDLQAMRSEWDHRDFWNPDPVKQHRDYGG
jgi:hypothetical protein